MGEHMEKVVSVNEKEVHEIYVKEEEEDLKEIVLNAEGAPHIQHDYIRYVNTTVYNIPVTFLWGLMMCLRLLIKCVYRSNRIWPIATSHIRLTLIMDILFLPGDETKKSQDC